MQEKEKLLKPNPITYRKGEEEKEEVFILQLQLVHNWSRLLCYNCQKEGDVRDECLKLKKDKEKEVTPPEEAKEEVMDLKAMQDEMSPSSSSNGETQMVHKVHIAFMTIDVGD